MIQVKPWRQYVHLGVVSTMTFQLLKLTDVHEGAAGQTAQQGCVTQKSGSGPVGPEIYTDSKGSQLCCKLAVTITDSNRLRIAIRHCRQHCR